MPCYSPLQAYQSGDGSIVFVERKSRDVVRSLSLPCGQCLGCRLERSRQWAMRCLHESTLHKRNCFVTLTYSDEFLPYRGQLQYPDFQRFMKRLRKSTDSDKVRFFMSGEYGEENWRPHYHAILFNCDFADRRYWRVSEGGFRCDRSERLERLWPFGSCEVGSVTFESAAYVARYCVSKRTGFGADEWYSRVDKDGAYQLTPEFAHMSLKPGIGRGWLEKFEADVYPHDYVVIRGKETKPPKYYDRLYSASNPSEFEAVQFEREVDARLKYEDNTPERLVVKETVQRARANFLKRTL